MKRYLSNAFSIQMLTCNGDVQFEKIGLDIAHALCGDPALISAIGHPDMAAVAGDELGYQIPMNRVSIKLEKGDELIVAQFSGGRLPEGTTVLPEGFKIDWWLVTVR